MVQRAKKSGKTGTLACSLVSSPALEQIAKKYGFHNEETLTGFKYIAKVPNLVFGFEEALGYLVDPDKVSDKDGISAVIMFLDLVRSLKATGKTIQQHIADFTQEFGAYASSQISLRVKDLANIPKLMDVFRQNPPTQIGENKIVQSKDYLQGTEPNNILVYALDNGSRLIVRPSGTEPKVKVYLDVKGNDAIDAMRVLEKFDGAVRELLRSEQFGKQDC